MLSLGEEVSTILKLGRLPKLTYTSRRPLLAGDGDGVPVGAHGAQLLALRHVTLPAGATVGEHLENEAGFGGKTAEERERERVRREVGRIISLFEQG